MVIHIEWSSNRGLYIYLNDYFFQIIFTHTHFLRTTRLSAFSTTLEDLLHLEYDIQSVMMWVDSNYMKLNKDKCHFLVPDNVMEHLWTRVGAELIWESCKRNYLG